MKKHCLQFSQNKREHGTSIMAHKNRTTTMRDVSDLAPPTPPRAAFETLKKIEHHILQSRDTAENHCSSPLFINRQARVSSLPLDASTMDENDIVLTVNEYERQRRSYLDIEEQLIQLKILCAESQANQDAMKTDQDAKLHSLVKENEGLRSALEKVSKERDEASKNALFHERTSAERQKQLVHITTERDRLAQNIKAVSQERDRAIKLRQKVVVDDERQSNAFFSGWKSKLAPISSPRGVNANHSYYEERERAPGLNRFEFF